MNIIDDDFKTRLIAAMLTMPIIYIQHYHYSYVDQALCEILFPEDKTHDLFGMDKSNVYEYDILTEREISFAGNMGDDECGFDDLLRQIACGSPFKKKKIFLLKGVAENLSEPKMFLPLMRFASNYESFPDELKTVTVVIVDNTPLSMLPPALLSVLHSVELPLPDAAIISNMVKSIPVSRTVHDASALQKELVETLKGLDQYQIGKILDVILLKTGNCLTNNVIKLAQHEKKQIIRKSGVLDVVESDVNLDMIGGLDVLRSDIREKAKIFRNLDFAQDDAVRLTLPKGILILGMPGCGKSMIAKAIANEFSVPLLRLDIGRLMGQYVGLSEENLRKALAAAEAMHPCVLWIDEIEKAFAGSQGGKGQEDSLVVRLMGSFLTWMQERTSPVYIVATANDVMRPEFMRKGRFDEVYFVDFPKQDECEQIFRKKIEKFAKKSKGKPSIYNFSEVENSVDVICSMMQKARYGGFSGAEIENVVNAVVERMFINYVDCYGRREGCIVSIGIDDFRRVIDAMRPSIMANQKGSVGNPTNIERILEVQKTYHFKHASFTKI